MYEVCYINNFCVSNTIDILSNIKYTGLQNILKIIQFFLFLDIKLYYIKYILILYYYFILNLKTTSSLSLTIIKLNKKSQNL